MSDASYDLHILILTEDSGGGGRTLRALTRSMLRLVDPSYKRATMVSPKALMQHVRGQPTHFWLGGLLPERPVRHAR